MRRNWDVIFIFAICFLVINFIGCGKKGSSSGYVEPVKFTSESDYITGLNNKLFADTNISTNRSEYLLGPGDLLEIKIFEADKLNTVARISSRGMVSLPLLGEINLDGLIATEAEKLIEEKYQESYIKDPHVNIFVKEHYSQRVTVIGQVKQPGTFDYPSRIRLLDAIALAGGLTEKADHMVQIKRLGSATHGSKQTFLANLNELINEGKTELNININGGDIIFVPEAGSFYVDGAVRRPGQYYIKKILSAEEVILVAGGFAPYANTDELILMREKEEYGEREKIVINLEKTGSTDQYKVQDGDIIFVNATFWGKVFSGGGMNIGIPGLGVSYRDPSK
jgi:polysaccharide biosynthesis/export protein